MPLCEFNCQFGTPVTQCHDEAVHHQIITYQLV